jgi:hypothetical protein
LTHKNFIKALDQNNAGAMNLKSKFSWTSEAKIKDRGFVGPQIRELIQDVKFEDQLSEVEKTTWNSLKNINTICLGKHKAKTIVIRWPNLYNPKSHGVSYVFKSAFRILPRISGQ